MLPILLQNNNFALKTLVIFWIIAVISGTILLIKLCVRNHLKVQFINHNAWKIALISLFFGRLTAVLFQFNLFFSNFDINKFFNLFYFWDGRIDLWSGLIAGGLLFYHLCKKNDQNIWNWIDIIIPTVILSIGIIHLGEFFDGIHYGTPSSLPWAVNIENPAVKFTVPIHPTQIYAFLYSTIIAVSLIIIGKRELQTHNLKEGVIGLVGMAAYSFFKFLEIFVRGDDVMMIGIFRIDQIISLGVFIIAAIILGIKYKINKKIANKFN